MNDNQFQEKFDSALEELSKRSETDCDGIEHAVWSEIAIRGDDAGMRWFQLLWSRPALVAVPVAAFAVAIGLFLGFSRAEAYDERISLAMERKYVETIHPVLMSASHKEAHAKED